MADGGHFENRYISEKSSDFREILYTAADFELDERHAIKNEKVALDRLRVRQNVFVVLTVIMQRHFRRRDRFSFLRGSLLNTTAKELLKLVYNLLSNCGIRFHGHV